MSSPHEREAEAYQDELARLRSLNAELVRRLTEIRDFAAKMHPQIELGPGLATCGCIKNMAEAALSRAKGDT